MKLYQLMLAMLAVPTAIVGGKVALSNVTYSEGGREGTVQKFSYKGLIWKTWEGELAQNGFTSSGAGKNRTLSNVFQFSATDSKIIEQIEAARKSNTPVDLQYRETVSHLPWQRSTDYVIVGVTPLKDAPATQPPVLPPQR